MKPNGATTLLSLARLPTPIGELMVVADDAGVCAVEFSDAEDRLWPALGRRFGRYEIRDGDPFKARKRFAAYFAGDLAATDALPLSLGGTPFQRAVWEELRRIPAGTTIAYRELAVRSGRPAAVRAAGHANGSNPLSIVVPCHRAIGADGSLTGYGGGIERKRWLLAHEGALPPS